VRRAFEELNLGLGSDSHLWGRGSTERH
jgi:hypothetical protein